MLRHAGVESDNNNRNNTAPAWAFEPAATCQSAATQDWRVVHQALRSIANRIAGLDAEEARWLREAEALKIWRPLGMVSAIDYMERVLGYAPRTAQDRLRVARALGALPQLTAALAHGELAFSAVRELTRVATPATEDAWIEKAIGKNLRQIEMLVADHHLGDRPDDPKDPAARMHVVRLELTAETFALLRQARQAIDDDHGTSVSEDQLIAKLCAAALDVAPASEQTGRARFQIAVTVCERCGQGWQHGAGAKIAIDAAAVDRALCDAQHIGSIDGAAPERAHQDVSPSVARFVWHRDGGRCRVPGCRSSRGLELHHVVHRADGGGHDANNLVMLCSSCHQSHHAGTLAIRGSAKDLEVERLGHAAPRAERDGSRPHAWRRQAAEHGDWANTGAHVGGRARRDAMAGHGPAIAERGAFDDATAAGSAPDDDSLRSKADSLRSDAEAALTQMGWKPAISRAAVAAAIEGRHATLEALLVAALQRCPRHVS